MKRLLIVFLTNVAALALFIFFMAALPGDVRDRLTLAAPAIVALWLLGQGGLHARRRWAVLTVATVAGLLFLFQVLLLAFIAWFERGFGNVDRATGYIIFLTASAILAVGSLSAFIRSKRTVNEQGSD
ncbi:MAG: hypothetical protein JNM76_08270 [Betaproteobacteria bacterium]|nr:hypothetical protein [Betaproteobacteria bacterium]